MSHTGIWPDEITCLYSLLHIEDKPNTPLKTTLTHACTHFSLSLHLPHKRAVDRAAVVVHDVLVGGIVRPHVGGSGRGVGTQVVLDFSHAVLGVAQVRDQQGKRGVDVGLGGGDVRGLREPT